MDKRRTHLNDEEKTIIKDAQSVIYNKYLGFFECQCNERKRTVIIWLVDISRIPTDKDTLLSRSTDRLAVHPCALTYEYANRIFTDNTTTWFPLLYKV